MAFQSWRKKDKIGYTAAVKLLVIIAFWEFVIMLLISKLHLGNVLLETILDSTFLTTFSGISIWLIIIKPEIIKSKHDVADSTYFLQQNLEAIGQIAIISMTDLQGKIVYANDMFCQISGYSREELIGRDHRLLKSGKHSKDVFRDMWNTIQSGKTWKGIVCNKNKNGNLYWVKAHVVPILDSDKNITNYISYRFDVTAEMQAEEQLEQEKIKNIHLSRLSALGEMAGGISHEINNPLAIVNGMLSIIDRKIHSNNITEQVPKLSESIASAQKQIQRITKIIQGLRNFSRSGDQQEMEIVTAGKLFETLSTLCSDKLAQNGVRYEVVTGEHKINCNCIQIEQVLLNLVNNAVDAIQNLPEKWIRIEIKPVSQFVEISVTDSGNGIPKAVAEKMMQPFFTTKEIGKGTGLGLSISHGIIKNHGGTLELDHQSPNTRFIVRLPSAQDGQNQRNQVA